MYVGEFTRHVTTFLKGNCGTVFVNTVIKETLRLHPLGPLLPREVQQQCEIGGFLIPENTSMIVNVYQIMRDPTVWEEQFMFAPERFLVSPEPDKVNKCLPFGSGRRVGPALGTVIVAIAVAVMVHIFDWNNEGGVDMDEHLEGGILIYGSKSDEYKIMSKLN
ncbi:unnamed protein product [Brassica oleracea var. botrytis]